MRPGLRNRPYTIARADLAALACAAAVGGTACVSAPAGPEPGFVLRDSAGVVIMENVAPAWGTESPLLVATEPTVRIGPYAAARAGQPLAATRLGNGDVVVADGGSRVLTWYDADGRTRRKSPSGAVPEGSITLRRLAGDTVALVRQEPGGEVRFGPDGHRLDGPHVRGPGSPERSWREGEGYSIVLADADGRTRRIGVRPGQDLGARYGEVRTDPAGRVWVRSERNDRTDQWDVYDGLGRWLGTVRLPRLDLVHDIGRDYVLGSVHDAGGRQWIVVHAMQRARERR